MSKEEMSKEEMSKEEIINQNEEDFKRYTGVPQWLFWEMTCILIVSRKEKESRGGRKPKLKTWEMLLMALEYWREYRTFFHVSVNYGVSESNCWKIILWIENTLIKSGKFSLPGKKALLTNENIETTLIDTTEREIERPKKNRKNTTPASRNVIL
jgi:hypothetical protein